MTRFSFAFILLAACGSSQGGSTAPTAREQPAPTPTEVLEAETSPAATDGDWTLRDLSGTEVSLASLQGKTVVLEWFNPSCPFIQYAHSEGPLKDMAARTSGDVVWLAINSSAKGAGAPLAANQQAVSDWGIDYPVLMDTDGAVGHMYNAKTTPHMFILDTSGQVVYQGALDNAPRGEVEGDYVNYVDAALADIAAGKPVATAETKAYGCGVKY